MPSASGCSCSLSGLVQSEQGLPWDVVADASIDGGHYVPLVGRRADGLHVIGWGAIQLMTEDFLAQIATKRSPMSRKNVCSTRNLPRALLTMI